MKKATLAQGNQVLSLILQKNLSSERLQRLLASGLLSDLLDVDPEEIDRGELGEVLAGDETPEIVIDRINPFIPEEFIGKGWSIAEQDEGALKIKGIRLSNIRLQPIIRPVEIEGLRGWHTYLKSTSFIRLDAKILQFLWINQDIIPKSWRKKQRAFLDKEMSKRIYFEGTVLLGPDGYKHILTLCFVNNWRLGSNQLDEGGGLGSYSAICLPGNFSS